MTHSTPRVTPSTHKNLSVQVAEELDILARRNPRLVKLLNTYIASLRAENARYRAQLRRMGGNQ